MNVISDKLKIPILTFQSCDNLAGYICVAVSSSSSEDSEYTRMKIICLIKRDIYFDMLVVNDSKEIEFNNRLVELLNHFTNYQMEVIGYLQYFYSLLVSCYFILGCY